LREIYIKTVFLVPDLEERFDILSLETGPS